MSETVLELIDEKITKQREHCKYSYLSRADYYKSIIVGAAWGAVVLIGLVAGVVKFSYNPITDISSLKSQMRGVDREITRVKNDVSKVDEKIDILIKMDK